MGERDREMQEQSTEPFFLGETRPHDYNPLRLLLDYGNKTMSLSQKRTSLCVYFDRVGSVQVILKWHEVNLLQIREEGDETQPAALLKTEIRSDRKDGLPRLLKKS